MRFVALVACLCALVAVFGCAGGEKDLGTTVVAGHEPPQPDVATQIKKIQDDPHMPPQAKAIAIGQLKAHSGGVQK